MMGSSTITSGVGTCTQTGTTATRSIVILIRSQEHASQLLYTHSSRSTSTYTMDVLIIIGMNDLLRGSSIADIMRQLAMFRDMVLDVAPGTRLGPSTFAVATIINSPHTQPGSLHWHHKPELGHHQVQQGEPAVRLRRQDRSHKVHDVRCEVQEGRQVLAPRGIDAVGGRTPLYALESRSTTTSCTYRTWSGWPWVRPAWPSS